MSPALALTALLAGADPAPRLDTDGFPLPPGAVARIGSSQFRAGNALTRGMYSPDGKYLVGETLFDVHVWDATTGRQVLRIHAYEDSTTLLGFDRDGRLVLTDRKDPRPRLRLHVGDPTRIIRLVLDEDTFWERSEVFVRRVEVPSGRVLSRAQVATAGRYSNLTLSPDARLVAYTLSDDTGIAVASTTTGRELWRREITGVAGRVGAFTPDGRLLTWEQEQGNAIRIIAFGALTGKPDGTLASGFPSDGEVRWKFSPDGKWLVVDTGGFAVWDTSRREADRVSIDYGRPLAFRTPLGFIGADQLLVWGEEGLEFWGLPGWKLVKTWKGRGGTGMAHSPVGNRFALLDGYIIDILDSGTGQRLAGTAPWKDSPSAIGFTGSNTLLLEYEGDPPRRVVWDPRTHRTAKANPGDAVADAPAIPIPASVQQVVVQRAGFMADVQFTPNGQRYVCRYGMKQPQIKPRGGDYLGLFDVATGRLIRGLPSGSEACLASYRISPDGRTVAVGWLNGTLAVVELATGRVRTGFRHEGPLGSITFSPDGRLIAAESWDSPVLVWDARGGAGGFPAVPPDAARLARAWADLGSEDAREAFVALRLLAAFPDRSLPFLSKQTPPDDLRAVRAVEAVEWMGTSEAIKLLEAWAGGGAKDTLTAEATAALGRLKKP